MTVDDPRPQEPFFVFASVGDRRFADFVFAITATHARRGFAGYLDINVESVGALPLDINSKEVQKIMAGKGFYLNKDDSKKTKVRSKGGSTKKVGKGKGSVNKGRKGMGY